MKGQGPSATWFGITAAIITVGIVVLLFDGVFWPLLLLPVGAMCAFRAVQAAKRGNF